MALPYETCMWGVVAVFQKFYCTYMWLIGSGDWRVDSNESECLQPNMEKGVLAELVGGTQIT